MGLCGWTVDKPRRSTSCHSSVHQKPRDVHSSSPGCGQVVHRLSTDCGRFGSRFWPRPQSVHSPFGACLDAKIVFAQRLPALERPGPGGDGGLAEAVGEPSVMGCGPPASRPGRRDPGPGTGSDRAVPERARQKVRKRGSAKSGRHGRGAAKRSAKEGRGVRGGLAEAGGGM